MFSDICQAICDLVVCFDKHGLKYLVGGSVSSSLNGVFRTTNDIDVLVEKPLCEHIAVVEDLAARFIVDQESLLKNHKLSKAYNIFHEATALKIDLFPAWSEFHRSQLERAVSIQPPSSPCKFRVASAEDIVLAKLLWFQKSPSDRQISDIVGVLTVNKDSLDYDYLKSWAEQLGVLTKLEELISALSI